MTILRILRRQAFGLAVLACAAIAFSFPEAFTECFSGEFAMQPDGSAKVTWEPDTSELRATRTYTTYGAKTLLDLDWTPVADANKDQYHFFKVEVKMR